MLRAQVAIFPHREIATQRSVALPAIMIYPSELFGTDA